MTLAPETLRLIRERAFLHLREARNDPANVSIQSLACALYLLTECNRLLKRDEAMG